VKDRIVEEYEKKDRSNVGVIKLYKQIEVNLILSKKYINFGGGYTYYFLHEVKRI